MDFEDDVLNTAAGTIIGTVDEAAEAHAFLDEKQMPRFDAKTGESLSLKKRIELFGTVGFLLDIFKK